VDHNWNYNFKEFNTQIAISSLTIIQMKISTKD